MYFRWQCTPNDHQKSAQTVWQTHAGISSGYAKFIRLHGECLKNGSHIRMIDPVSTGDIIELFADRALDMLKTTGEYPNPAYVRYTEQGLCTYSSAPPLSHPMIIQQDGWFLAVNKPAHLTAHARFPGAMDAVDAALAIDTLHPVNRLDRHTSGVMLLARNSHAHYRLSLRQENMEKIYLAVVQGVCNPIDGTIKHPIARREGSIIEREVSDKGQSAITHYETLITWHFASLVAFRLETGRTHQIRVHAQSIGHPLIGDTLYGSEQSVTSPNPERLSPLGIDDMTASKQNRYIHRQALHSWRMTFPHPITNDSVIINAPLYQDMIQLITKLGTPVWQRTPNLLQTVLQNQVSDALNDYAVEAATIPIHEVGFEPGDAPQQ